MNVLLFRALKSLVRKGTLTVTDANGVTDRFGDGDPELPSVALRFLDRATERAILTDPRLGAAEAYIDGRLVIEQGDVMQLATLARAGKPFEEKKPAKSGKAFAPVRQFLRGANPRAKAQTNVAHHYDLDDRLYDRFLDPWRQYSCAYWTADTPDLDAAQRAKLAHIIAKLDVRADHRVLDIGCGWGGLAIAIAKLTGADVTGITLSVEQRAYAEAWAAREGLSDRVRFQLIDYRDVPGPFDRIVSVGMFEHVGVPDYGVFFRRCHELLPRDGVMLLHSIGRMSGAGATDAFTNKYIFPGGYIPALSEVLPVIERTRLITADCEILRLHYAHTLRAWYDRCLANRDAIEATFDDRFFRMWTFYLAGATAAFEHGGLMNFQLQLIRDRRTLPLTRDYMAEIEKTYRAKLDAWAAARP